jgi:hypothetical protein
LGKEKWLRKYYRTINYKITISNVIGSIVNIVLPAGYGVTLQVDVHIMVIKDNFLFILYNYASFFRNIYSYFYV